MLKVSHGPAGPTTTQVDVTKANIYVSNFLNRNHYDIQQRLVEMLSMNNFYRSIHHCQSQLFQTRLTNNGKQHFDHYLAIIILFVLEELNKAMGCDDMKHSHVNAPKKWQALNLNCLPILNEALQHIQLAIAIYPIVIPIPKFEYREDFKTHAVSGNTTTTMKGNATALIDLLTHARDELQTQDKSKASSTNFAKTFTPLKHASAS